MNHNNNNTTFDNSLKEVPYKIIKPIIEMPNIRPIFEITKIGKKRKIHKVSIEGQHNKFSSDNLRRKSKILVLKSIFDFVNNKLIQIYENKIGYGLYKKEFQTLTIFNTSNDNLRETFKFVNKSLGDIFSEKISKKITTYLPEHNQLLYGRLINEKDENKRTYFKNLFQLQFIKCLNHYIGKEYIPILEGMKTFNDVKNEIKEEFEDGNFYINKLEEYMKKFENEMKSLKPRKIRKKTEKNINLIGE